MSKDILLFMSDQHSYRLQGYAGDPVIRTPMLDQLAAEGTVLEKAMTSCPLCVPARASMISGQLPSNNGVLFNFNGLSSDQATFLHSLNLSGYETVLCGRMHFVGPDQRHGYAKRIAGDRTPVFHNGVPNHGLPPGSKVTGFDENSSLYYIGEGDSPVLAYDRYVVDRALDYLARDHERPQFLTVGLYGPHFPYVAPPELYDYYYDKVDLSDVAAPVWEHPVLAGKMCETDPEVARAARAAYYGLVEVNDRHMRRVYEAFQQYLSRTGREGIFIYVSDHGDMNGSRGYYGKQVFYEPSVHIPFVFAGAGIAKGRRISSPVSLMDMGPTVCELAGAKVLPGDGKSLAPLLTGEGSDEERIVISEQYTYCSDGRTSLGRMCRYKDWKYITYSGFSGQDILFDLVHDPAERTNVLAEHPELAALFSQALSGLKDYDAVMQHENWVMEQLKLLIRCHYDDPDERWQCPVLPELDNPIQRKTPFSVTPWAVQLRKKLEL